ncbi:MAG: hypothetical protein MZV70_22875 [Desulfobacterales bacterium]|nr:hypothetical protein [Desulfobacterales bacterium]
MREPALINPVEQEDWNNLLISTPGYSFFHTSNWAEVLRKSYNYTPVYLCAREQNQFASLLPVMEVDSFLTGKRGVCLPFTDMCEPIAENAQQFQKLFDQAVALGRKRKWKYLAIRGGEKYLSAEQPAEFFYGHKLDLAAGTAAAFSESAGFNTEKHQKGAKRKYSRDDFHIATVHEGFLSIEHNDTAGTRPAAAAISIFSATFMISL